MKQSLAEVPPISCRRTNVASSSPMSFCTDVTRIVFVVYTVRMDPSLNHTSSSSEIAQSQKRYLLNCVVK